MLNENKINLWEFVLLFDCLPLRFIEFLTTLSKRLQADFESAPKSTYRGLPINISILSKKWYLVKML